MGAANFGRHLAYWLYGYEMLKVGKLITQVINRDFSSAKDPMLNFQKKKTKQRLQGLNIFVITLIGSIITIHMSSSSFIGVLLTYLPQLILIFTLWTGLLRIRDTLR